jgi:hypothetical protein
MLSGLIAGESDQVRTKSALIHGRIRRPTLGRCPGNALIELGVHAVPCKGGRSTGQPIELPLGERTGLEDGKRQWLLRRKSVSP